MQKHKIIKFILFFLCITVLISAQTAKEIFKQAEKYFNQKEYRDAIYFYKKALKKNPYYTKAIYRIAKCYNLLNDIDNAEKYYKKALSIDPNYLPALNSLGYIYITKGKASRALKYFKKVLNLSPLNYDALIGTAKVYIIYRDYETAERYLNQAIKKEKTNPKAYIALAQIYILKEKFKKALSYLDKAKTYAPGESKIYFYKAVIDEKTGNLLKAKKNYEKAFALNKNDSSIILNLSEVYLNTKEWSRAIKFLEKAKKLFPDNPLIYSKSGFAYQMKGKIDSALDDISKAIEMNITDDVLIYYYENLLLKSRSFYDPQRIKWARTHFKKAEKFVKLNQHYDALTEYRRGLQIFSEDWEIRYKLGLLYKKLGYLEKYLKELKLAIKLNPDKTILKDKLEIAETFRKKRLSYKLDIDQYSVPKNKVKILILNFKPAEEKYIHLQAGKVIADSINNHLRNYFRFYVYELNKNKYYIPYSRYKIRKFAERLGADYYVFGNFEEQNDYLAVNFQLYTTKEDEPLKSFSSVARGKDKLYYLSKDIANKLNKYFPVYGKIIDIRDNYLVLNIGKAEGCKKNDKIEIYSSTGLYKEPRFHSFHRTTPKKKSTATIIDIDEQISLAKIDKKWDINKVSINDTIKLVHPKKKSK